MILGSFVVITEVLQWQYGGSSLESSLRKDNLPVPGLPETENLVDLAVT